MQEAKEVATEGNRAINVSTFSHEYLTVVETAMKARLSPKTLYNWISMGKITRAEGVYHAGRKVVIHWSTFEAMVLRRGEALGEA